MDYFSDLQFVCFGNSKDTMGISRDRYFDYYGLQFIRSGEIYVDCEGVAPWQAYGPVLFLTAPGRKFTYYTPSGSRDHSYVCFRGDRVERYLSGGLLPPPGEKIAITEEKEFSSVMTDIIHQIRRRTKKSSCEAVLLLEKALFLSVNQPPPRQVGAFNYKIITDFAEKIAEHPEQEWKIGETAAACDLSEVHFRRLFQRETGLPPNRYILEQRIRYAAHLLETTDMLVKEIAFVSGFGGEFYFSRQFSRIMKQSPTEFRKKLQKGL